MSDEIQVGDKIRALFEAEVVAIEDDGTIRLRDGDSDDNFYFHPEDENAVNFWVVERARPAPVLPDGLTVSEDGSVLNWLGENYVRQPVEHPVVTFGPGDVVRRKGFGHTYTIGKGGYVSHHHDFQWFSDPSPFDSKYYTKVELHEAPL